MVNEKTLKECIKTLNFNIKVVQNEYGIKRAVAKKLVIATCDYNVSSIRTMLDIIEHEFKYVPVFLKKKVVPQ